MQRILEPELMDGEQQALAYAQANFSFSNQLFVDQLLTDLAAGPHNVIDLGCGPADVLLRLSHARPDTFITGVDGSAAMIDLAASAIHVAGLEHQILLLNSYIPEIPVAPHTYTAILSKSFLHHLRDPMALWQEAIRLGKPGAALCVMDLIRPRTPEAARTMVEKIMPHEKPVLKRDFFNSLQAAFTVTEVEEQLHTIGLRLSVQQIGDRYMLIRGRLPL